MDTEKKRDNRKKWELDNPEKLAEYRRRDNEKQKEKRRLSKKETLIDWANPAEVSERKRQLALQRRIENPEYHKENDAEKFSKYYKTTKGRTSVLLCNAKSRAKKLGILCSLSHDWISAKLDNGICEVTGIPFTIMDNGGKGHINNPFAPSIDRINQTGDYTPENCRITVWIYNRARGAFTDDSFDIMIESLINRKS